MIRITPDTNIFSLTFALGLSHSLSMWGSLSRSCSWLALPFVFAISITHEFILILPFRIWMLSFKLIASVRIVWLAYSQSNAFNAFTCSRGLGWSVIKGIHIHAQYVLPFVMICSFDCFPLFISSSDFLFCSCKLFGRHVKPFKGSTLLKEA